MRKTALAFVTALSLSASALATAAFAAGFFGAAASAQKAPNANVQEIIIKSSLLTFNDANVTNNYSVFHAKLSKPFRDKFPPDKLAETFKGFRDQHVDLDLIAAKAPLNHVNNLGLTALLEAIVLGNGDANHTATVRALVEAGADINRADRQGTTPLQHARRRGYVEMARILEGAGGQ